MAVTTIRDQPVRMGVVRRSVRELGLGLITAGIVILLFVAYQLLGTNLTEEHNQSLLRRSFASELVAHRRAATTQPATSPASTPPTTAAGAPGDTPTLGGVPVVGPPDQGGAIDHLVIPRISLDKYVVEGVSEDDLRRGPGHYPGTALPGQVGNTAIAGHRTTYGAPFFRIAELAAGDDIFLTDVSGHRYEYRISGPPQVVSPSDVAVLDPTTDAELTLTTCNPAFSATSRLIIHARLVGIPAPPTPVAPATATPRTVRTVTNLDSGTSQGLTPALIYGALVLAGWVLTRLAINRTRRLPRVGAYLVGIGVCAIPLWFCFENVVLLLPQSI